MRAVFRSTHLTSTDRTSVPRSFGRLAGRATPSSILLLTSLLASASAADSNPLPPSITTAPLSVDQVVNNLIQRDQKRAKALRHFDSTRVYRLSYRGFLGDRDAEMTVDATFDSPSTKNFKVLSQSGSKSMIDHAFKRLLDGEKEAAEPDVRAHTLLNRDNYNFALVAFEPSAANSSNRRSQYVLAVSPKTATKYVYRGKIWVDATDFAVTKIDAEPAQNPSFWTKTNEVHHEYMKVQDFWLPRRNESVSYIRLGGRATLTIDYENYRIVASPLVGNETKPASSAASAR